MMEDGPAKKFDEHELDDESLDSPQALSLPDEASDGQKPLRAPHSPDYYGAIYPDMPQEQAKELADNDQKRYERELRQRRILGGFAASS